jgi:hypothetical protein
MVNNPVFTTNHTQIPGMNLRDLFAAIAMHAQIVSSSDFTCDTAYACYGYADMMLQFKRD